MSALDTPMFRQYMQLKAGVPDSILFFRMGDFYELFFDDAKLASEKLELTLTSRNKNAPDPVPMAGVPHHAAAGYIQTLVDSGYKVAIADQVQDPKLAKGIVRREVVRVVSPGVILDPESLSPREHCWLAGLDVSGSSYGLALLDVSTGDLRLTELFGIEDAIEELRRAGPSEIIISTSLGDSEQLLAGLDGIPLSIIDDEQFNISAAHTSLSARFRVKDLSGFGCEKLGVGVGAAAAVIAYAADNSRSNLPHLLGLEVYSVAGHMVMDDTTRRNLELVKSLFGGRGGSLIAHIDRTTTPMGGRLLKEWLLYPLLSRKIISARHDAVEAFIRETQVREVIRASLRLVSDIERIGGKLAQGTAHARDLANLKASLFALPVVFEPLLNIPELSALVPETMGQELALEIDRVLVDEPPISVKEGGLIREGVDAELDELISLSREGKGAIASIESREREVTGIPSLKVRYNKVFGYFIEVTRANLHKVPDSYIRKQTLTNAERYITVELKEFEEKVLGADERRRSLEYVRFVELRDGLQGALPTLKLLSAATAKVDVFAGFAELAVDCRYVRPRVDESSVVEIVEGRHPVVERQRMAEAFVPNDIYLGEKEGRFVVLTGPNMSGKSTIMRQVALIVIMAQSGSFVPANSAHIGICDRVFTRVGASDDIRSGRSTFMVEMSETANILRYATKRSLVLLDEIGRGTSTFDGLAIAWAVAEGLTDSIKCRGIFATHYHELVELASTRKSVANLSVAVSEWGEKIIFLRKLEKRGASRSYGIQCAKLAGMPPGVIKRAKVLLKELELHATMHPSPQLSLFDGLGGGSTEVEVEPDALHDALGKVDVDDLTPRQALELVYDLSKLVRR
jgi:DNA mismatch repair protein MutS